MLSVSGTIPAAKKLSAGFQQHKHQLEPGTHKHNLCEKYRKLKMLSLTGESLPSISKLIL